jgi:hypothetical protein
LLRRALLLAPPRHLAPLLTVRYEFIATFCWLYDQVVSAFLFTAFTSRTLHFLPLPPCCAPCLSLRRTHTTRTTTHSTALARFLQPARCLPFALLDGFAASPLHHAFIPALPFLLVHFLLCTFAVWDAPVTTLSSFVSCRSGRDRFVVPTRTDATLQLCWQRTLLGD